MRITMGEAEMMYDEMLREVYEPVKVCGFTYEVDQVLKAVDPTAYRCGLLDYIDSLERDGYEIEEV